MSLAPKGSSVVVLGASPKEDRYSFKAVKFLKESGFEPIPVHPRGHDVFGVPGVKSLGEVEGDIDTLTLYINEKISTKEYENILALKPRRVIFNPGAENSDLAERLAGNKIETIEACTLVMLRTNQF